MEDNQYAFLSPGKRNKPKIKTRHAAADMPPPCRTVVVKTSSSSKNNKPVVTKMLQSPVPSLTSVSTCSTSTTTTTPMTKTTRKSLRTIGMQADEQNDESISSLTSPSRGTIVTTSKNHHPLFALPFGVEQEEEEEADHHRHHDEPVASQEIPTTSAKKKRNKKKRSTKQTKKPKKVVSFCEQVLIHQEKDTHFVVENEEEDQDVLWVSRHHFQTTLTHMEQTVRAKRASQPALVKDFADMFLQTCQQQGSSHNNNVKDGWKHHLQSYGDWYDAQGRGYERQIHAVLLQYRKGMIATILAHQEHLQNIVTADEQAGLLADQAQRLSQPSRMLGRILGEWDAAMAKQS